MSQKSRSSIRSFINSAIAVVGATALLLGGSVSAEGVSTPHKAAASAPRVGKGMSPVFETANTIDGSVQNYATGDPAVEVSVELYDAQGALYEATYSNSQGTFSFDNVPAGNYTLHFAGDALYESQWFEEKFTRASAEVISVSDQYGWHVDANVRYIGDPTGDSSVATWVHDSEWNGVSGAQVHLFDANLDEVDVQTSDDAGAVRFDGLNAGSYTLCYEADGYDYECNYGAPNVESAEFFWLEAGESRDWEDFTLRHYGTVSGLVVGRDGNPMENALVAFYTLDWRGEVIMWGGFTATTDEDGLYTARVEEGPVRAVAAPLDDESPLAPQWWEGALSSDNSTLLTISGDTPLNDIDFELHKEGSSVGVNVWCGSTGTDCEEDPYVEIYALDGTLAQARKVAFGSEVVFNGLSAGRYVISTNDVWLGGDGTRENADIVTVRDGEDIRGITHVFPENVGGATVSGNVLLPGGGPAAGYDVRLFTFSTTGDNFEQTAQTDDDGYYEFAGVAAGTYSLGFSQPEVCDDNDNCYRLSDYWGGVYSYNFSEFFDLHSDDEFTANFTALARTSRITGTVKNAANVALAGVDVTIFSNDRSAGDGVFTVTTAANGTYTVNNLAPGTYRAVATKDGYISSDVVYNQQSGPSATVAAGATGTIPLITLTPAAARISGKVTGSDAATTGLGGMSVIAIRKSDGYCVAFAQTEEDGNYTLTGLAAGSYAVWAGSEVAEGCGWYNGNYETSPYIGEFLTDKPNLASATAIALTASQNLTAQNFVLQKGASIGGTVTLKDPSRGFADIKVSVYGANNILVKSRDDVDSDGNFSVTGLPAGVYSLKFEGSNLSPTWWEDSSGTRRAISLTAAQSLANVAVEMGGLAAVIKGSIKSPTGAAVSGIVEALDSNGVVVATSVSAGVAATYALKVPAGVPVRLRATVTGQEFWLGGATSMLTSPWVSGIEGSSVTARDIITAAPSQISGRVTVGGKTTQCGGDITLFDPAGQAVARTNPGLGGIYSFTSVMPGTYTIFARACSNAAVFYGNKDSIAAASYITASGGTLLEGIDIDATAPTANFAPGAITLTGVPKVGTVMTVALGTWTPAPSQIIYRWYTEESGGYTPDPKAVGTAASYTIAPADLGKVLSVTVTVMKNGYTTDQMWIPAGVVAGNALTASPVPTITGGTAAKVGTVLTAVPGTWTPAPVTVTYQWMKAGEPIPGATSATYTPTAADAGARLTVRTVGTKAGSMTVLKESVQTSAVALQALTASPIPTIAGTARVGSILTATAGAWTPAPVGVTFQWKRNGTDIPGATGPTYLLTAEDQTRTITVAATGSKVGFTPVTKTSVATAAVAAPPASTLTTTPTPTISGTARIDSVLTVTTGTWAPAPVTLSIQWLRNGVAIPGANSTTYTLGSADVGKTIRVSVKGTKATFASVTKMSAATAAIATGQINVDDAEAILTGGDGTIGEALAVDLSGVSPTNVTIKFQWLRDGEPIRGARHATYVPTARDFGFEISVKLELSKPGYTTNYVESDAVVAYY